MTVLELKEQVEALPEDAVIKVRHELIGDEHYAERLEYNDKNRILWICETY